MTTETQVSPVAETQNPAPETTETASEVVTEQATDEALEQTPERDERDKTLSRMERRINRKHAEAAAANERARLLEERLAKYEQQKPSEEAPDEHEVERKALTLAQEIAQKQEFEKTVKGVLNAGKALPKFDEACNALNEELPFYERNGKPSPFLSAVLEFDAPAQLLHHLGSNPELAAELADLSHTRLVRKLDAIERELTDKAKPKTSAAPKPLEPVKATASETGLHSGLSDAEWIRRREAEIKARRG